MLISEEAVYLGDGAYEFGHPEMEDPALVGIPSFNSCSHVSEMLLAQPPAAFSLAHAADAQPVASDLAEIPVGSALGLEARACEFGEVKVFSGEHGLQRIK